MNERTRFSILDILRILGGVLLLNSVLSWYFTSSGTWGYRGKWIDPRYLRHVFFGRTCHFTLKELSGYDGSNPALPIYLAVNGSVYDVSASPQIYGIGGPYHCFSGRDGARAFVTGCFHKEDEFTYDLRGIDSSEAEADIKSWQKFFASHGKYFYVGTVDHPLLTGDPPKPCKGAKFPQNYKKLEVTN